MTIFPILHFIRLPNLLTAASNVLMGGLVVGASWQGLVIGMAASMALYAAGAGWNDLMDHERDRALHPSRPLPSGRLSRKMGWVVVGSLAGLGLLMAAGLGVEALGIAFAIIVAIAAYNMWLKSYSVFGPVAMGLCRGLNVMMGLFLEPSTRPGWWMPAVIVGMMGYAITCFSIAEEEPDGLMGKTGAVVMGVVVAVVGVWAVQTGSMGWWMLPFGWLAWMTAQVVVAGLGKMEASQVGPWVGTMVRELVTLDAVVAGTLAGWPALVGVWALRFPVEVLSGFLSSGDRS